MGERKNCAGRDGRSRRPPRDAVFHFVQRNQVAYSRRGDSREHGAHAAYAKLSCSRAAMGAGVGAATSHRSYRVDHDLVGRGPGGSVHAAGNRRDPDSNSSAVRWRHLIVDVGNSARYLPVPDCVRGLPVRHRANARQSLSPRGLAFCRQTAGHHAG